MHEWMDEMASVAGIVIIMVQGHGSYSITSMLLVTVLIFIWCRFKQWLAQRPEQCIAVVCHCHFIRWLLCMHCVWHTAYYLRAFLELKGCCPAASVKNCSAAHVLFDPSTLTVERVPADHEHSVRQATGLDEDATISGLWYNYTRK